MVLYTSPCYSALFSGGNILGAKVKLHNIKDTDHISGDSIVQYQCHFQTKDKLLDILYDM